MKWQALKRKLSPGQGLVIGIPYLWLLVLFLIPFFFVLKISLAEQATSIPPYTPLYTVDEAAGRVNISLSYLNYTGIFDNFWQSLWLGLNPFADKSGSNLYVHIYLLSIKTAITTTLICLLAGYPIAYAISRSREKWRNPLLLAIMLPFWFVYYVEKVLNELGRDIEWIVTINEPTMYECVYC